MDLTRLEILLGEAKLNALSTASVAIIGLGGVGGICAESLARCGISRITICDGDVVEPSNINRQIVATTSTIGINKAIALGKRLGDINPDAQISIVDRNWTIDDNFILDGDYDYVVDAIDSVPEKIQLIHMCKSNSINIVSAMGAGCRHHGNMFEVTDIFKTFNDPLAKKIRRLLKEKGVQSLDVVYSKEKPQKAIGTIGSAMYAVGASGLMLCEHVVEQLTSETRNEGNI